MDIPPRRLLALVLTVAAALRLPGLFTELWLDEIWSVTAVETLRSPLEVFSRFKSDNNHHLNSLWIYAVGPGASAAWYRLAAFVSGLAAVVFAWLIGARDGKPPALVCALLVATCFPLVAYSSETRGYSLVVAFALGAWYFLQRYLDEPGWRRAWPFWLCTLGGLLSHLTMIYALAGSLAFTREREQRLKKPLLEQALGIPALGVALFAVAVWRGTELGGGPPYSLPPVLADALAYGAGVTAGGVARWLVAGLFLVAFAVSLGWQVRRGDDRWFFSLVSVVAAPVLVLAVSRPPFLFVRYFALQLSLLLLAVGTWVAYGLRLRGTPRLWAIVALSAYLLGNGVALRTFWREGRGAHKQALVRMCEETVGRPVTVASDHDFRNRTTLEYHARSLGPGCRVEYVPRTALPTDGADWVILHSLDPDERPRATRLQWGGQRYVFDRSYLAHRLSGLTWHLYRRAPIAP